MVVDTKWNCLGAQPLATGSVFKNVKFYVAILNWTIPGLTNTTKIQLQVEYKYNYVNIDN